MVGTVCKVSPKKVIYYLSHYSTELGEGFEINKTRGRPLAKFDVPIFNYVKD